MGAYHTNRVGECGPKYTHVPFITRILPHVLIKPRESSALGHKTAGLLDPPHPILPRRHFKGPTHRQPPGPIPSTRPPPLPITVTTTLPAPEQRLAWPECLRKPREL